MVVLAVPLAAAAAAWRLTGERAHTAGLAALVVVALLVLPRVLLPLVSTPVRYWGPLLAGRRRRARYRQEQRDKYRQDGRGTAAPVEYRAAARSGDFPAWVKQVVMIADRHKCVSCGERGRVVADHYCPWAGGGLSILGNAMTLCWGCNSVKLNFWRDRDGYVHYRNKGNPAAMARAAEILAAERRARRNPFRPLVVAVALALAA